MKRVLGLLIVAAMAAPASAQIVVDGTKDAAYGGALSVQTTQTGFGDNASEWNAGYAKLDGGFLKLMLTGNLEANFNKLAIFIDSKAGGQSVFDSSGNDSAAAMDGLTFDVPFTADYHLIARRGSSKFDLDFANLGSQSASGYFDVFGGADFGAGSTGTGVNGSPIAVAYNGSNVLGVTGGTGAADQTAAAAVTTGLELGIALSDLGYVGGPIRIMVGQNNQDHNYWSNQFLGGLATPQDNLMGPGGKDFTMVPGDQFFTLVPEPASAALVVVAGLGLLALGRKRLA
jgi:hypothetical protein